MKLNLTSITSDHVLVALAAVAIPFAVFSDRIFQYPEAQASPVVQKAQSKAPALTCMPTVNAQVHSKELI